MARITTCVLRIASTCLPHNIRLAIAAQIFVAAGVLLIFIINIIFAQRIMRAYHPNFGWHKAFSLFLKGIYALIVLSLAMLITCTVQSFYTLNQNTRRIDRDVQLYGATFFMFVAFLPIPLVIIGLLIPRHAPLDKFGTGRFRHKVAILLTAATLLTFGAAYRCGTSYRTPVPRTRPLPSYFHKAAFYFANFVVEIIVVYLYAIVRFDLRFHVPNGARGYGSYSLNDKQEKEGVEKPAEGMEDKIADRLETEEETFDNQYPSMDGVVDGQKDEEKGVA
jgi:hypothetical protein